VSVTWYISQPHKKVTCTLHLTFLPHKKVTCKVHVTFLCGCDIYRIRHDLLDVHNMTSIEEEGHTINIHGEYSYLRIETPI
jgi:hypothetical protein